VVITGANSGIGRAATEVLAGLGARVTMVCRDGARAELARAELAAATGRADLLTVERCDLSRLDDVAALAARLTAPVDVLIHNAGLLPAARTDTPDGLEMTWATHVAGPHLLTRLVRPRLSPGARVVWVSSGGMYLAPLVAPGTVPTPYDGVRAYALTKRAQVVLASLWAEHDPALVSVSMHPGWADTAAVQASLPRFRAVTRPLRRDAAGGADTIAWLAAVPGEALASGAFYFDRAKRGIYVAPWQRESPAARAALWRWCEDLAVPFGARASGPVS
jgi:NAD(P)-dependent dehydrogenase (short-subunit alcohol dehydrogenase family)